MHPLPVPCLVAESAENQRCDCFLNHHSLGFQQNNHTVDVIKTRRVQGLEGAVQCRVRGCGALVDPCGGMKSALRVPVPCGVRVCLLDSPRLVLSTL